jgi:hypothetical protein
MGRNASKIGCGEVGTHDGQGKGGGASRGAARAGGIGQVVIHHQSNESPALRLHWISDRTVSRSLRDDLSQFLVAVTLLDSRTD